MKYLVLIFLFVHFVSSYKYYGNLSTLQPANTQLLEYKLRNIIPDVYSIESGAPVDVRDTITMNTDVMRNIVLLDSTSHQVSERLPEREVFGKGTVGLGYFELHRDISEYTSADLFRGRGKKTPITARFAKSLQGNAGSDLSRDPGGMAIKFYTQEGNFDLVGSSFPVYTYRDPSIFRNLLHAFRRNPRTNLFDPTSRIDFITQKPTILHSFLYLISDYGIPNGYRTADGFAVHTYEIYNAKGEVFYVKFNFRSEQGLQNLTTAEAQFVQGRDMDYFIRDLYNAIARKNYPAWTVEMYVMDEKQVRNVNYDPFDVTRLWEEGDYKTINIGRIVLNENPDNMFRFSELVAFNPANVVPGIRGPIDDLFALRQFTYLDAQNYRLGINNMRTDVNAPLRRPRNYNRDGAMPVKENNKDAPNYEPNSFNGPEPIVDEGRPTRRVRVLQSNAVDLQPASDFYNKVVTSDAHRQRIADNLAGLMVNAIPRVNKNFLRLLSLTDKDLEKRTAASLIVQSALPDPLPYPH